jgi:hypothetical protein
MSSGTYEGEVVPIQGAKFLDRILGWLSLGCGIPILGVAIYRLTNADLSQTPSTEPSWVQMARVCLVAMGLVGIASIMTSKPMGFMIALWLHVFRLLAVFALYPWSGGPRFSGTELVWNITVIVYCWLRLKSLPSKPQSNN